MYRKVTKACVMSINNNGWHRKGVFAIRGGLKDVLTLKGVSVEPKKLYEERG